MSMSMLKNINIFKTGDRPELHLLIEAKEWDAVMLRIETHSAEARKVASCPVLYDTFKKTKALPLANAICNHAPVNVVSKLLDEYPQAIQATDTAYGRMPLSLALLHCVKEDVILELLSRYPDATKWRDKLSRNSLHYAIANRHPKTIFDRLMEMNPNACDERDHRGWLPLHVACARGAPLSMVQAMVTRDPMSLYTGDKHGLIPKDFIELMEDRVVDAEVYDYLHRRTRTFSGFKFNFAGQFIGHREGAGGWYSAREAAQKEAMQKREAECTSAVAVAMVVADATLGGEDELMIGATGLASEEDAAQLKKDADASYGDFA